MVRNLMAFFPSLALIITVSPFTRSVVAHAMRPSTGVAAVVDGH